VQGAGARGLWAAFALCACGVSEPDEVPPPPKPLVVLVTLESLRVDHVGAYGGVSPTRPDVPISPMLDAFAREATVYDRAHAVTSWTLSSHASLFTGLYPTAHQTRAPTARLGDGYVTLAERLREAGYQTGAVVSGPYLRRSHNLTQGFDWVDESSANPLQPRAHTDVTNPAMEAGLIRFIERVRDPERPFFLFAYFWDPHFDYLPPAPYDTLFVSEGSERIDVRDFDISDAIHPGIPAAQLDFILSQYAGEIRATDELLGRFFGLLRQRGLWDDALIIVTADHGEEFFEHGKKGHKKNLHVETVQVPLFVKYPAGRGAAPGTHDSRLVSLVDVVPTVLELAGAEPADPVHGRSLLAPPDPERPIFFELLSSWYVQRGSRTTAEVEDWAGIRVGDAKMLVRRDDPEGLAAAYYDLVSDPGEQHNLAASRPDEWAALASRLADQQRRAEADAQGFEPGGAAELDHEASARLCALGYLDCAGPTTP